jgi:GT2 family glycosyltransferase
MKYNIINENKALDYPCNYLNKIIFKNSIGDNGNNLTIVVLSLNRSNLTIKLINSIDKYLENFQGELLIIDNNSKNEEKNVVKKRLEKCKVRNRFIELDKNYGVAGGRNKAIQYVNTDWLLNLDNDIYFINNPIKKINDALCTMGCHFMNLPLLDESGKRIFANGGALYVSYRQNDFYIGGGSFYEQGEKNIEKDFENSLSNFLFGGASIINKQTFINCGMFDDNMFIGFEDTDFSLRLYNLGYKIGSVGTFCLIHNHVIDEKNLDIDYEKIRFSSDIIRQSGLYFENKNGLKVLDENVELWLEQRQKRIRNFSNKKSKKNRL